MVVNLSISHVIFKHIEAFYQMHETLEWFYLTSELSLLPLHSDTDNC